ncbi:MAG: TolC family protein, partial [Candidatus Margulisiibacteriota bacterium]
MVIRSYGLFCLLLAGLCSAGWLQEKSRTWPSVCSAKYALSQSQAAYDDAVSAFYPNLSASAGLHRTLDMSSQTISPDYYVANASIELNINLLTNGLSNFYRVFQKGLARDQAELRYRQVFQQTQVQLLSLMSSFESKQKWTHLYQEQSDLYKQVLSNTEHAYTRGEFSDLFVSNARLQFQSSLITLEESAMQLLAQKTLLDSLEITPDIESDNCTDRLLQVISQNIERLPTMLSANFDITFQQLEEKRQYWIDLESQSIGHPSLKFYAQRSYGRSDENSTHLLEDPLQAQSNVLGLLVSWPLFSPNSFP